VNDLQLTKGVRTPCLVSERTNTELDADLMNPKRDSLRMPTTGSFKARSCGSWRQVVIGNACRVALEAVQLRSGPSSDDVKIL